MKKMALGAFLLFFPVSVWAQSSPPAPVLSLRDIQGRQFSLSDYKGKVVLVNFWATWCPPCRTEIPDLVKMHKAYRNQGLQVIGITYPSEKLSEVRRFARKLRMNYRIALGTKASKTIFTSSETLPVTVIIDRNGLVSDLIEGVMYPDEFDQKVRPLLSNASVLPTKAASAKQHSRKVQTRRITVGRDGYQPAAVTLRRQVPAKLTFIRTTDESCGAEVLIPAYGIRKTLPLNVPVIVAFMPNKSGRIKFTCGMDMFRGAIVVH